MIFSALPQFTVSAKHTYFQQRINYVKYFTSKQLRELRKPVKRNE